MKKEHGILKFPAQLEICKAGIFLLDVFGCVFLWGEAGCLNLEL